MNTDSQPNAGRVEKVPPRGQRISRQPWQAWAADGRYLGVFANRRIATLDVERAAQQEADHEHR